MIKDYIKLLRPHQYLKNLIIFTPLIFAIKVTHIDLLINTLIAFVAFSLLASSIYIFNDIQDINEDRNHPTKKDRPLASEKIPINKAFGLMFLLFVMGSGIAWCLNTNFLLILLAYFTLNIFYSLGLKHLSIIDIIIVATGFVLRVFAGSIVINVNTSEWIIIITFLLALFLALAKRRDDVILCNNNNQTRKNIDGYNLEFINSGMIIMASVIVVAYILYTISAETTSKFHTHYLYLTTIFVITGIVRYMQITFVENNSGSPTNILIKDRFLQLTIVFWLLLFIILIYKNTI
jgi:4-hydroxybenzoate polyprenyltransferase